MGNVASFVIIWTMFFVVNFSNAQEIHTQANAASIDNESNSITGWGGNLLTTSESNDFYSGSHSIKFEAPTNGWYRGEYIFSTTPGEQYEISIYAKSSSSTGPGFYWDGFNETSSISIGTNWTEYTTIRTASGTSGTIWVYTGVPAVTGNSVLIDHVSITPLNNLALNKPTMQSSVYGGLTSDLAVDGNTNGDFHTHTQEDLNPFWRVDLQNPYNIGDVRIFNRSSSSQSVLDRLVGFKLYIGNTDSTNPNDYMEIMTLDGSLEQSSGNTGTTGRYVMIYGAGLNEFLSLAEVQVYESGGPDTQSPISPNLSSTGQTDTTADLSWSSATDNIGVTGYKIFKDGIVETTLANVSTYQVIGLTASTAYSFTVSALDAAGNESPVSNAVSITTDASSGGGGGGSSVWTEANSVASYSGDVAVGTASVPTGYKMAIDGKLITEEVKVQLSGNWPDYVFKEDYALPTLEEIQKYIKEKGHLPNIPSAEEVKDHGMELGEMNRLLLEKIEELTLYILQLKEEINLLKNK